MDGWDYYTVTMELRWMKGGDCCDAQLEMKIHAKSEGHAIARVMDHLQAIGSHTVDDATARKSEH